MRPWKWSIETGRPRRAFRADRDAAWFLSDRLTISSRLRSRVLRGLRSTWVAPEFSPIEGRVCRAEVARRWRRAGPSADCREDRFAEAPSARLLLRAELSNCYF